MQVYFSTLLDRFQELHREIRKVILDLPAEALDWEAGPDMNSVSILVVHLTGAERYWVGDVAMGEPSDRNRNAEFTVSGLTNQQLLERLDSIDQYLSGAFEHLTITDLDAIKVSPRNNHTFSVGWSLLHALEHSALHLGHLQIIRQLWQQRQGK